MTENIKEQGSLSINSENIMPIIKKWLYSDQDIFIRELVSNAADAVAKLKKLVQMGGATVPENEEYAIKVVLDKENNTIEIIDNGIGMTADEIKTFINQIAFSGASAFLEKYGDKAEVKDGQEIIGHFGLGFYSAFMVADTVEIDTKSFVEGSVPAHWQCDGGTSYTMSESERAKRGTTITLNVSEDGKDFLNEYKLREVLNKYCEFMPVDVFLEVVEPPKALKEGEEPTDLTPKEPELINEKEPLWLKDPKDCTDEEYKNFYHKVFNDYSDPLFWIHLNMDYPFRLKGILYFPRLKNDMDYTEGQVKLYNNQVFVADNIKEVIPEFLLLLKGTLDCPDIPLNVSRSFLQNDSNVTKMSGYITRKVADKLNSIFKKDRENYNTYWSDISVFIKYGCIRDKDFYEKIKDSLLLKTIEGELKTIADFKEQNSTGNTIYYVSNEVVQAPYIKMFKDQGMSAAILTHNLDNPFISYLESYDSTTKFMRIDAELDSALQGDEKPTEEETKEMEAALQTLVRESLNHSDLKVTTQHLKSTSVSALMLQSEQGRRMEEMTKMFGGGASLPQGFLSNEISLVLNTNSPLVKTMLKIKDDESKKEEISLLTRQIYDLALMSHTQLDAEQMAAFIERSNKVLELALTK